MSETFSIRVNYGPEQTVTVETTVYRDAVAAIPALLGLPVTDEPIAVEIWAPRLLPDYGPFHYLIRQDEYVNFRVEHAV